MPAIRPFFLLCAGVFAVACATSGQLRELRLFQERPSKPEGCEFEVYEQREPPQEYEVIGTLGLTDNEWMGAAGRKQMLSETVCRAGADAVILSSPVERKSAAGRLRDYEAQFISFALGATEPAALPGQPPAEPGAIIVPRGMEWPEESMGESTRKWEPEKAEPPAKK
ncbi:hypothetical protein [Hyalangium versicolor]|uniref:hypothetical protein n=1 Tax=Hyalangium versicolor TaxID=2861190 RepID=UPI001CCEBBE9|nr:hypothetical protein [Hyalangium versicolor]